MARPRNFDRYLIDEVARAQGGIVTFSQLRQLGMSNASVSRWTRTGGVWQRVLPGTYLVHRGTPTLDERLHAGLSYAGNDAVVTGIVGLHLYGLRYAPGRPEDHDVHLLVPMARHVKSSGFVIIERTARLPVPTMVGGFPVAPLPRTVFDAARRHQDRHGIRAFLLEAVQRRRLNVLDLQTEIKQGQRRWTAVLREVVGDALAGVRSIQEAVLRDAILASDLPDPLWNPRLETLKGEFIAEPDGYYEDLGIALELDSRGYHYVNSDQFEATWGRHSVYNRHRIIAERIVPSMLRPKPDRALDAIRGTRSANAGRTPPEIRVIPTNAMRSAS